MAGTLNCPSGLAYTIHVKAFENACTGGQQYNTRPGNGFSVERTTDGGVDYYQVRAAFGGLNVDATTAACTGSGCVTHPSNSQLFRCSSSDCVITFVMSDNGHSVTFTGDASGGYTALSGSGGAYTTVNSAPVANAGPDQTNVPEGSTVTLDGSTSSDADNNTLTYKWTQTSGPSVTLSDNNSTTAARPTFTAPNATLSAQTLIFQLVVNDGTVNSAADTISVTIAAWAPKVGVAQANDGSAHYGVIPVNGGPGEVGPSLQFNAYGGQSVTPGDYEYGWSKNDGVAYQSTYLSSCTNSSTTCHVKDNAGYCWTATKPANGFWSTVANITDSALAAANNCVNGPNALITTQAVPSSTLTVATTFAPFKPVTASGGTAPHTFALDKALPAGLTFDSLTGEIGGTPSAASSPATYTVTVTDSASPTPRSSSRTFSLVVNKATQTITFPTIPDTNYGYIYSGLFEAQHRFVIGTSGPTQLGYGVSASSGLPVSFGTSGPCEYSNYFANNPSYANIYLITFTGPGTCTITASQAGNGSYEQAEPVTRSFSIAKGDQYIAYDPIPAKTFSLGGTFLARSVAVTGGNADYRPFDSSSKLLVGYTSQTPAVCSVGSSTLSAYNAGAGFVYYYSDATVTMLAPGTCTLRASQTGDANFNPASDRDIAIVLNAPALTTTQAVANVSMTVDVAMTPVAPVTASGGIAPLSFSVAPSLPKGLSIDPATGMISGTPEGALSATVFTIEVTDSASPTPKTSSRTFTLTVLKGNQSSLAAKATPSSIDFNDTSQLTTSGGSGSGAISFAVTAGDAFCSVSGDTLTGIGVGNCTVTATKAADADYNEATATVDVSVGKAQQDPLIATAAPPSIVVGEPSQLTTSGGSGSGAISFAVTAGDAFCSVSGDTLTGTGVGNCTVTATKAADANYNEATATVDVTVIGTPGIALAVTANPGSFSAIGQTITYAYTITNTGNVTVTQVSVSDTRVAGITCAGSTLAAGASTTCTGSTASTASDINARGISSTAAASAMFNGATVSSTSVETTVGLGGSAIQQATQNAIESFVSERANLVTSMGPDVSRFHSRFGSSGGTGSGGSGFASSSGAEETPNYLGGPPNPDVPARMPAHWGADAHTVGAVLSRFQGRSARSGSENPFSAVSTYQEEEMKSPAAPGFAFNGSGNDTAGQFSFSTSLSEIRAAARAKTAEKETQASALAQGGTMGSGARNAMGLGATTSRPLSSDAPAPFDIWIEGQSSYFKRDFVGSKESGHAHVLYAGADYLLSPGLLVGLMAEFDWMKVDVAGAAGGDQDGRGWMVGPYASARLTPNLFLDVRAMLGRSDNNVDPLGAYIDSYQTERALASIGLTGEWSFGVWTIRPSAEALWYREEQDAYTNAVGIGIGEQTITLGRAIFGPEASYRYTFGDATVLEPYFGIKGIWDFASADLNTAAGDPVAGDNVRARVELGLSYRSQSGVTLRGSGAYDGLGTDDYEAYQGQVQINVPLQ